MSEYDSTFDSGRPGALMAAKKIVPLVIDLVNPKSVVDVGCGTGEFLSVFKEHGVIKVLGVDGEWVNKDLLKIDDEEFKVADLELYGLDIAEKFDLAVCLEVAEHFPESRAESFVEELVGLAPVVLFSAAVPFQGGVGHVNERWPSYWVELFEKFGYNVVDCLRGKIWFDKSVYLCYRQNLLLFVKEGLAFEESPKLYFEGELSHDLLDVVHPEMYMPRAKNWQRVSRLMPGWLKRVLK